MDAAAGEEAAFELGHLPSGKAQLLPSDRLNNDPQVDRARMEGRRRHANIPAWNRAESGIRGNMGGGVD